MKPTLQSSGHGPRRGGHLNNTNEEREEDGGGRTGEKEDSLKSVRQNGYWVRLHMEACDARGRPAVIACPDTLTGHIVSAPLEPCHLGHAACVLQPGLPLLGSRLQAAHPPVRQERDQELCPERGEPALLVVKGPGLELSNQPLAKRPPPQVLCQRRRLWRAGPCPRRGGIAPRKHARLPPRQ